MIIGQEKNIGKYLVLHLLRGQNEGSTTILYTRHQDENSLNKSIDSISHPIPQYLFSFTTTDVKF